MTKIIRIIACEDCPYFRQSLSLDGSTNQACIEQDKNSNIQIRKRLPQIYRSLIPEWCPLEDSKE